MFLYVLIFCFACDMYASNFSFLYRQADSQDIQPLVFFINDIGKVDPLDTEKLVMYRPRFVEQYVKEAVNTRKVYIGYLQEGGLVAYKKLFVPVIQELSGIMQDEIRCIGLNVSPIDYAKIKSIDGTRFVIDNSTSFVPEKNDFFIYTGADYVEAKYRGQKIGEHLYAFSLNLLFGRDKEKIDNASRLIFLYGLTQLNDYDRNGKGKSRTTAIVKSIITALQTHTIPFQEKIEHFRTQTYMPKFEDNGDGLQLLPDEQAIPGFGNVVVFNLKKD